MGRILKHLPLITAAATVLFVGSIFLLIQSLPIPTLKLDSIPKEAIMVLEIPENTTLEQTAYLINPIDSDVAESVRGFALEHPEISNTLISNTKNLLTFFPVTDNGNPKFILHYPKQILKRQNIIHGISLDFPTLEPFTLPDSTQAYEILAKPEDISNKLEQIPGTELVSYSTDDLQFIFGSTKTNSMFSVSPKHENLLKTAETSKIETACLDNGIKVAFPSSNQKIRRWKIQFSAFPGIIFPILSPNQSETLFHSGNSIKNAPFLQKIGDVIDLIMSYPQIFNKSTCLSTE